MEAREYAVGLSVQRAHRELDAELQKLCTISRELSVATRGRKPLSGNVSLVVACVMADAAYPPDEMDDGVRARMASARECQDEDHLRLAQSVVERCRMLMRIGQESLQVIDFLGKTLPSEWHNLSVYHLARKLAGEGHAAFRGHLPGYQSR